MRNLFITILSIHIAIVCPAQVTVKMKREGGVSVVPCKVNGLNLKFIFDTGASNVSISMTEATFMLKNDYLSTADIIGTSKYLDANGNISEGVNIILKEIEIGGMKLYNVKASVVTNMKAPLLLGQSAISKLGVVQLDLNANTLTILNSIDTSAIFINRSNITEQNDTTIAADIYLDENELKLDEADNYFKNGNYQHAISICNEVIKNNSKNERAYFIKALCYDYLEEYSDAIRSYSSIIELNPKDAETIIFRGKSKFDNKDFSGALIDYNKGLTLDPKYLRGYIWRAQVKEELKNPQSALLDFTKAISISPLDSSLFVYRAILKRKLKDYSGSISDCNKAISINSDYANAYYQRGDTKEEQKNYKGALEDYNQAIYLDEMMPEPYAGRAGIKERVYEDFEGALEDYNKALEISPSYTWAALMKSFLEEKIKNNVWIKVVDSKDGDKWYLYNSTLSKDYSTIKLWVKREFKTYSKKVSGKTVTYTNGHELILMQFNCKVKELKQLEYKVYDSKGNIIEFNDFNVYSEWKTIAPQTIGESLLNEVCERYN